MRSLLSWLALAVLCMAAAPVRASDCDKLLVPADVALPAFDTTADLAYLAAVTADNFPLHKANAAPKLAHVGVLLPIASRLLQYSKTYDEFRRGRTEAYAAHGFDYSLADLAAYYRRLLPAARLAAYESCSGTSGLTAHVVWADRDFVQVLASWRPAPGGPASAPVKGATVSGAVLTGAEPIVLTTEPTMLVFVRNRNADLRWSADVAGAPVTVWVPHFVSPAQPALQGVPPPCADAAKVVHALYRQTLEREPKPAELAALSALLKNGTNNVSQLAARLVLGDEYQNRFARDKSLEDVLIGLHKHVYARVPDVKGLANNKKQLHNEPYPAIVHVFFVTGEYQRRFGEWNVPGDPPALRYCPAEKKPQELRMQCFSHPAESAIGICKSCGKGVCRTCAIGIDRGLACSEQCKPFAESLSQLQQTSIRNIGLLSAQRLVHPVFSLLLLGTGTYFLSRSRPEPFSWFLIALGVLFGITTFMSWIKPKP